MIKYVCMIIIGETKVILNEGMPQYKNIDNRGRLIVEFKVHTYNINKHTHVYAVPHVVLPYT